MSIRTSRISTTITITGQSQQADTAVSIMGRIEQMIVTSNQSSQTFDLELRNTSGDIIMAKRTIDTTEPEIKPDLLPGGVVTFIITDPVPATGSITIAIIQNEHY